MTETTRDDTSGGYRAVSIALFLCLFAGQAALIAMSPVLADAASDLDVSAAAAGQLRTITGLAAGITALMLGAVAGRVGLGRQLLMGSAVLALASIASAAAPTFLLLTLAQLPVGLAVAVLTTAGTLAAAEWVAPELRTRTLSWALLGQPTAWIVGMPLIGALGERSWRYGWLALPLAAAVAAAILVASRAGQPPVHSRPARARAVLADRTLARWLASELLVNAAWAGTLVFAGALFVESYGTSTTLTGCLLAVGAVAYVAGNLLCRRLIRDEPRRVLMLLAVLLALTDGLFGAARTGIATSTALFASAAVVAGGRTLVASSFGLATAPEIRPAVMALRATTMQFGYFAGSIAGGAALAVGGYSALGATMGALFLAAALTLARRPSSRRAVVERNSARPPACAATGSLPDARVSAGKRIGVAALGALLLVPATAGAGEFKRPRPSDVPAAVTSVAPNDLQLYNDYASPEGTYSSRRAVVHYVALGIDAPPLNDDDADGAPDYVERVGEAADRALAYYERRGFRPPRPDETGPDARPDIYVSRFSPGTLGVAFPASRAEGGAFAVVSNNLDPSPERSFASIYATVAHELFHLVQFSYFRPDTNPAIPTWILEGTAAALETRVNPGLDDLVSTIQLRRWFSATERSMTTQSYGAQLLWRQLDAKQPRLLPALFARLAARLVAGERQHAVAATYARVAGKPFADEFHRFAVSVAADHADDIEAAGAPRRAALAPLSVNYVRVTLPSQGSSMLSVTFPRGRASAATTLVYRVENDRPGYPAHTRRIAPRVADGGRTLAFMVSAGSRTSALLVLSNGGARATPYAVSAR